MHCQKIPILLSRGKDSHFTPEKAKPQRVGAAQLRSSTGRSQTLSSSLAERPSQATGTGRAKAPRLETVSGFGAGKGSQFTMAEVPKVGCEMGQGG